jgi:hypothetical protein
VKTCGSGVRGQRISRRAIRVASPSPISSRCGEPPKLDTDPTARYSVRGPAGVSSSTFTRAPTASRLVRVPAKESESQWFPAGERFSNRTLA